VKYAWVALFMVVASASLGRVHPFGDPRAWVQQGRANLLAGADLPPQAKALLVNKCADCHSNETRWPMYARVAPGSWLIERDIMKARKQMNLSLWQQLPPEDRQVLLSEISRQAKNHAMPPLAYVALHHTNRLSDAEVQVLSMLGKSVLLQGQRASSTAGDPVHGKELFAKRCTGCHSLDEDREGPKLAGVYGRAAGSVQGFDYSAGLKKSGLVWNDASLEKWLSGPDQVVADTKMDFYVPKAEERRDLIAFFKR
jgi:cytochrome c